MRIQCNEMMKCSGKVRFASPYTTACRCRVASRPTEGRPLHPCEPTQYYIQEWQKLPMFKNGGTSILQACPQDSQRKWVKGHRKIHRLSNKKKFSNSGLARITDLFGSLLYVFVEARKRQNLSAYAPCSTSCAFQLPNCLGRT